MAAIKQRLECMNHKAGQRDTISLPTTTVPIERTSLYSFVENLSGEQVNVHEGASQPFLLH